MIDISNRKATPDSVEYRTVQGRGQKVVRVYTATASPRIITYVEDGSGWKPASLFLDEILDYVTDAHRTQEIRFQESTQKSIQNGGQNGGDDKSIGGLSASATEEPQAPEGGQG